MFLQQPHRRMLFAKRMNVFGLDIRIYHFAKTFQAIQKVRGFAAEREADLIEAIHFVENVLPGGIELVVVNARNSGAEVMRLKNLAPKIIAMKFRIGME